MKRFFDEARLTIVEILIRVVVHLLPIGRTESKIWGDSIGNAAQILIEYRKLKAKV